MNWTAHRKPLANTGFVLFAADLLLYGSAISRTPHIDPTSPEFITYYTGGIVLNVLALILASFGSGWKRTTVLLSGLALTYLWISYIGIETMKH
jgi:uncharacterized membrane protein YccF (DUF307 family)